MKAIIERFIEKDFNKTLSDIKKILQIKTVKDLPTKDAPFGEGLKIGLEEVLEIAKRLGFKTTNLDNYIGYAEIGSGDEYIAILGHIDVVPAGDESKWKVMPFSGEIVGNEIISRGALDNKAPIISALHAMYCLKELELTAGKKIRVIFGTNEESGDEDIKYYLKREKPPKYAFTPDGRFPVVFSEKGIYTFRYNELINLENSKVLELSGGEKSNVIPEKCSCKIRLSNEESLIKEINELELTSKYRYSFNLEEDFIDLTCFGVSAHASSPQKGVNPIIGMFTLLDRVLNENDSLKNFSKFVSSMIGEYYDGSGLEIDKKSLETGDLTLSVGIAKLNKNNIEIKINIRYPQGVTEEFLNKTLEKKAKENGIRFVRDNHNPPLYFDRNSTLVKALQKSYLDVTGRDEKPVALGGGTYAKLMPNTVAFGPNFVEYKGNPHGVNESIDIEMLRQGMVIYALGVLELLKN
ncbi:Sapep family Mn(2+)-dependent dipeptidase [Cetobacterium sp.]|uniref:Sapep family Mn(2+)-dependent dipeptidase n=2 Tax=Cetobacterium sp. TaxID=2071632 RepID=UPI002FC7110F